MKRLFLTSQLGSIVVCVSFLSMPAQGIPTVLKEPIFQDNRSRVDSSELAIRSKESTPNFSNEGRPGNSVSGSTRSTSCIPVNENLVALSPSTNYGGTIRPDPTLWFYIPASTATTAQFIVLENSSSELVFEISVPLPGDDQQLIGVNLPAILEESIDYVWYFIVVCDPDDPSANAVVEGVIRHIEIPETLEANLTNDDLPQHIVFENNQIWFDAVDILIQRRLAEPNDEDLQEDWERLMLIAGLDFISLTETFFDTNVEAYFLTIELSEF